MSGDTHDTRGRRKRRHPISTGKRLSLTDRDWHWLQRLAEHGPLGSAFLLALAHGYGANKKRARERLTDLFNEDNTPHGRPYLTRPPQQFHTLDSRYNQLVYDLAPAGKAALAEAGTIITSRSGGPWLHQFMTSSITASIELATQDRPDLTYIPQSTILARAGASLATSVPLHDPKTGEKRQTKLAPDAVFGLQYETPDGPRYRFFAVEADRATEPLTSANFNRKSAQKSALQYQAYVADGRYREHLKLTAPLLVLNVSSDPARTSKSIRFLADRHPAGLAYQLFQSWEAFAPPFRPPEPNPELLIGPWRRPGVGDFFIDRP